MLWYSRSLKQSSNWVSYPHKIIFETLKISLIGNVLQPNMFMQTDNLNRTQIRAMCVPNFMCSHSKGKNTPNDFRELLLFLLVTCVFILEWKIHIADNWIICKAVLNFKHTIFFFLRLLLIGKSITIGRVSTCCICVCVVMVARGWSALQQKCTSLTRRMTFTVISCTPGADPTGKTLKWVNK